MRFVLILCALLLLTPAVRAEEQPTVESTLETRVFTAGGARVEATLGTDIAIPLREGLRFVFEPRLDIQGVQWGQGAIDDQRVRLRLPNGYLEWTTGSWQLRLGQQDINFGAIDDVTPLNFWGPRDLRDFYFEYPVGNPVLSIRYTPSEKTSVRFLYAPTQLASSLPAPGSPWWVGPTVPFERGRPTGSAFALALEQRLGDANFQFVAMRHADPFPAYLPTEVGLREHYVRETMFGGSLTVPFEGWTAIVEAAWHHPDEAKDEYLAYAARFERIWQLDENSTFTFNLGYADSTLRGFAFDAPFKQAVFAGLEWSQQDEAGLDTTVTLKALRQSAGDFYLNPEFARQLTPDARLTIGGNLAGGSKNTFFGELEHNNRLYLKFEQKF